MRNRTWLRASVVWMLLGLCLPVLPLQAQEKPLPDPASFISEFRKRLHTDDKLLNQYTYTEKETSDTLDSKGKVKKSEINVYQVFNSEDDWKSYRRQIVKNGVPVSEKELGKEDREEKERVEKETNKREKKSEADRQKDKAKADRDEQEILDDVFAMYDLQLVRRDILDGIPAILVTFKPKADFKPKTREGKALQHIGGSTWIAEDDHELARLEAEIIDPISIGAGILAKVNKGSTVVLERRKINGEIWLPFKVQATLNAKVLLLKGFNLREASEYSDYKKFGVDVQLIFGEVADKPPQ
jgi:hypothetical protein